MLTAIEPAHYPWLNYKKYTFSLGLKATTGVFLSGNTASEHDAASGHVVVKGGMAEQAKTAYAKIAASLEAAKLNPSDVTRIVEYVTPAGLERYGENTAVRETFFSGHRPAVNTVPVFQLLRPDALIEIEATAGEVVPLNGAAKGLPSARESGGVIYLPTILPVDDRGAIVGPGDVSAQTEQIFKNAQKILAALGSDLSHVVSTIDYLTPAARKDYRASGDVRFKYLGPVYPGAAGIMQQRLIHPEALVQYDMIATRDTPEVIDPGWARYKTLSYSAGVKAGKLVFMSGQGAMDPVSLEFHHADDIVGQAEFTYMNLLKVLEVAGGHAGNLVKTTEFIAPPGVARYRDVAAVRKRLFNQPYPASSGVGCFSLLKREMQIEIVPFAILD